LFQRLRGWSDFKSIFMRMVGLAHARADAHANSAELHSEVERAAGVLQVRFQGLQKVAARVASELERGEGWHSFGRHDASGLPARGLALPLPMASPSPATTEYSVAGRVASAPGAASPQAAASSVERHARTLLLGELNVRSASCGEWDVAIFRPRIEEWKIARSGALGAAFRCILVSAADPRSYVAAQMRMQNADMQPLRKAMERFQNYIRFIISKVALLTETRQALLHCPVKLIIDLAKTRADPSLTSSCGVSNLQAQPPATLSEVQRLSQSQRFDVTALIAGVDDAPHQVSANRKVIHVQLLDASGPGGKAQKVTFGFFYDHPPSGADLATMGILCQKSCEALSFFGLQGKRVDGGLSLGSSQDFFVVRAVGERAAQLEAIADALDLEMHRPTRKRGAPWSDALSPADAKKCRVLGRSSAEGPLDEA
jgi:hypothetical protein